MADLENTEIVVLEQGNAFQRRYNLCDFDLSPEQFWNNAQKKGDCWEWIGELFDNGYGKMRCYSKSDKTKRIAASAHRYSYFLTYGYDPGELLACHHCDNRPCIRPDHIFLGTDLANKHDMVRKRRLACPEIALTGDLQKIEAMLRCAPREERYYNPRFMKNPMACITHKTENCYLVQMNRHGARFARAFPTLKEAQDWRNMIDLLLGADGSDVVVDMDSVDLRSQIRKNPMCGIEERNGGYRVLVRRKGQKTYCRTFATVQEAQEWRDWMDRCITAGLDPLTGSPMETADCSGQNGTLTPKNQEYPRTSENVDCLMLQSVSCGTGIA